MILQQLTGQQWKIKRSCPAIDLSLVFPELICEGIGRSKCPTKDGQWCDAEAKGAIEMARDFSLLLPARPFPYADSQMALFMCASPFEGLH